jgi:hypothetical protein
MNHAQIPADMNRPPIPGFHVYKAPGPDGKPDRNILSPLGPQDVNEAGGLCDEAIIGEVIVPEKGLNPENFIPNPAFIRFLHKVLAIHAPKCPGLIEAAKEGGTGTLLVLDKRSTKPPTEREPKDILGWVEIQDGRLVRYTINPRHQIVTDHGFTVMDPWYQERLIEELKRLTYRPAGGAAPQPAADQ